MFNILNYFSKVTPKIIPKAQLGKVPCRNEEQLCKVPKHIKHKNFYVIVHNNTQCIIGVFDDLDKAVEAGRKSTYCNCSVYKFNLNEYTFLNNPIYQDK